MKDFKLIKIQMRSLVIFRGLLEDSVIRKLGILLDTISMGESAECQVNAYADFVATLFGKAVNLSDNMLNAVLEDENLYILRRAQGKEVDENIEKCLQQELTVLEKMSRITSEDVIRQMGYSGYLPAWHTTAHDFAKIYEDRMISIPLHGYGTFAKYHVFRMEEKKLIPVKHPDKTSLQELNGYELERKAVVDNTIALLNGKPAANVLLYGDAGTGKSATVKAIANQYHDQGLRLIELQKNQLRQIPRLLDLLGKNPLKFILFIDDLTFTQNDDDFAALKAILEGSVAARALNLVVYATSNRRHLIKENFRDREGDDIHFNDTMEELTSLSERFGLTVTFSKPNKQLFLEIVKNLAEQYGVVADTEELEKKAEAYALGRGGRSPRVAKQFIEYIKAIQ